jgi:hypothetical protein
MAKNSFKDIDNKGGVADLTAGSFGLNGFDILDDASAANASARYYGIVALETSEVDCTNLNDGQVHTLIPMIAGMQMFGVFSDVSVAAGGKILAYKL